MATITDRYVLEVDTQGGVRNLGAANTAVGGLAAGIGRIGPLAVAAGAAIAGIGAVSAISNTIDEFDELAKSARLAGAAASEDAFTGFQVLQQAMAEAGIDAATFDRAMLQTTSRLQEGLEGGEAFAEIFNKLGDSVVDSEGQLVDGATALEAMINALNDGTISTDEFAKVVGGRAGPLIQQQFASLNTSAEDLAATLADVEANSNIVSLDAANNAEVFNDTIGRLGEQMGQLMTDAITPLLPLLVDLAEGALAALPVVIDAVKEAFAAFQPVIEALQPLFGALLPLFGDLFDLFIGAVDLIAPVIAILADGLVGAIQLVIDIITTVVQSITGFLESLGNIKDTVSDTVSAISGGFGDMASSVGDSVSNMAEGVQNKFTDMWNYLWGGSVAKDIVETTKEGFGGMKDSVLGDMFELARGIASRFGEVFNNVRNSVGSAVGTAAQGLSQFGGRIWDTVSSAFDDAEEGATQTAEGLNSAFDGLNSAEEIQARAAEIEAMTENMNQLTESAIQNTETISTNTEALGLFDETIGGLNESVNTFVENMGLMDEAMSANIESANALESALQSMAEQAREAQSAAQAATNELNALQAAQAATAPENSNPELAPSGSTAPINPLDFFAGAFATGGFIPRGQFGLVGEAGPEFVTGPAEVTPVQPSVTNVRYEISAVDAKSFRNLIAKDPGFIHSIAEQGRRRIPGGRR